MTTAQQEIFGKIVATYEREGKTRPAAIALAVKEHPTVYRAAREESVYNAVRAERAGTRTLSTPPRANGNVPTSGQFESLVQNVMTTQNLSRPKAAAFVAMNYPEQYKSHCRKRLGLK